MRPAIELGRTTDPEEPARRQSSNSSTSDEVPEEDCVRQDNVHQERAVEGGGFALYVALQVLLEVAVGERRACNLVFAEEQKENTGGHADHGKSLCGNGGID